MIVMGREVFLAVLVQERWLNSCCVAVKLIHEEFLEDCHGPALEHGTTAQPASLGGVAGALSLGPPLMSAITG
jgi:hypothetical protein